MPETPNPPPGPDLLTDPLFTILGEDGGTVTLPLPALIAQLLVGAEVAAFPNLAAEQHGHWWRFLVRCGAKAVKELRAAPGEVSRLGVHELAETLEQTLRALGAHPNGWLLYQPEPSIPGFLQPPVPNGKDPKESYTDSTCSWLSTLTGEKGHERKISEGRSCTAEQAAFGLIELQLGAYYGGPNLQRSQITSGGYSGTPFVGARIGSSNGATFQHDVQVLLDRWPEIVQELRGDIWALWMQPWDGSRADLPSSLDPAFIPLARLVRLGPPERDRFEQVWYRPTPNVRIQDETKGSIFGDPFAPLASAPDKQVRRAQSWGYNYEEAVGILFSTDLPGSAGGTGEAPASVKALQHFRHHSRTDVRVLFEGVSYTQGGTKGFHRREVPLPATGPKRLGSPDRVRSVHSRMIKIVREAENALGDATYILLRGDERSGKRAKVNSSTMAKPKQALEQRMDQIYLGALFEAADREEKGDSSWIRAWAETVAREARDVFDQSLGVLPVPSTRQLQRTVRARECLKHRLRKLIPTGSSKSTSHPADSTSQAPQTELNL